MIQTRPNTRKKTSLNARTLITKMRPPFTLSDETADRLFERFRQDADKWKALSSEPNHSQQPSRGELALLIEICFWASMLKEEGRPAAFSIIFLPPSEAFEPLIFHRPLPFTQEQIAKLSAALLPANASIGVWRSDQGVIEIWGFTESPVGDLTIKVFEPGHLLVSSRMVTALVTGADVQFVDPLKLEFSLIKMSGGASVWKSLLEAVGMWLWLDYLKEVASAMRAHGRGGTLVVVDKESAWAESFTHPLTYAGTPTYDAARIAIERYREERGEFTGGDKPSLGKLISRALMWAKESLQRALQFIGQLTAADGATIVTADFELLAFGAKIVPLDAKKGAERILISEPFEGVEVREIDIADWGKGTRHRSAAQLVFDQHDALVLTVSADGGVSLLRWDDEQEMVSVITHLEYVVR